MLGNLAKLILGFVLAIAVLLGTGITIALYFVNRTGVAPEKPMFANDYPQKPKNTKNTAKSKSKTAPKPTPTQTPTETPTESPTELPPNAYKGIVTWSSGLSLRSKPEQGAESVGGVGYNQEIIVLEESPDGKWKKIRVGDSNQEGWVKSGNLKKSDQ